MRFSCTGHAERALFRLMQAGKGLAAWPAAPLKPLVLAAGPWDDPEKDATPPSPAPRNSGDNNKSGPPAASAPAWLVIAITAGVLSGFFFTGIIGRSMASFLLFYASPFPLFMVGLAFGWVAAAVAGAAGALYVLATAGMRAALFYLLAMAVAPVILSRLALMWRPAAGGGEGEAQDEAGREWYPEGRLLIWLAVMGGVLVSAALLLLGTDLESIREGLGKMADAVLEATRLAEDLPPDQVKTVRDYLIAATPPVSAIVWMLTMLVNFWAGGRLAQAFGYPVRPWAPFWKLTLHPRALAGLAVASFATFLPGIFGLIGEIFASTLLVAFMLLGLAVVHAVTLGNPWRPVVLAVLYFGLLVLNWLIALPLVILGMAEVAFGIRRRVLGRGGGPPGNTVS